MQATARGMRPLRFATGCFARGQLLAPPVPLANHPWSEAEGAERGDGGGVKSKVPLAHQGGLEGGKGGPLTPPPPPSILPPCGEGGHLSPARITLPATDIVGDGFIPWAPRGGARTGGEEGCCARAWTAAGTRGPKQEGGRDPARVRRHQRRARGGQPQTPRGAHGGSTTAARRAGSLARQAGGAL